MRRLPPLNAVRAFEAAARLGSFTRAAQELCVTQTAISHQVRRLEGWLNQPLFIRHGHQLTLTAAGQGYLRDVGAILDQLARATSHMSSDSLEGVLKVSVLPSFASRWLVPRLPDFHRRHPGIDLQLSVSLPLEHVGEGGFDAGIRSGLGGWAGLRAELLSTEWLSPVCAPSLLQGLRAPDDLRHHRLLQETPRDLWARWLAMAGVTDIQARAGRGFSDSSLLLQAAAHGDGVAIGRLFLAWDDLQAGRLAQPFELALQNDYSYWLVTPETARLGSRTEAFRQWVLGQTAHFRGAPPRPAAATAAA